MTLGCLVLALVGCHGANVQRAAPLADNVSTPIAADGGDSTLTDGEDSTPIHFIENDYARALAEARTRRLPLFVDAWALWCHTCLSMRAFVFPDQRLRAIAARFVWLSLDTEREENAAFVTKLRVKVLPTFYVIDPQTERVALAWGGAMTAPELVTLLDATQSGEAAKGPLAVDMVVGRANSEGRLAECAEMAGREAPTMPPGTALVDVLRSGIECAEGLGKDAPERRRLGELADLGKRVVTDPTQPILADDRSDLYDFVINAYRAEGRAEDAKALAFPWISFLEDQAARAETPAARTVFDSHRLLAYLAIDTPQRAIPMCVEESERDFPSDYNPSARLATAWLALKNYDAALAASRRALERAYGPRKLRIWSIEADVRVAQGNVAEARASLRAAINFAHHVPLTGAYPKQLEAIEMKLAALGTGP